MRCQKSMLVFILIGALILPCLASDQEALTQNLIKENTRVNKKIALTFDDGPNREYTPGILRTLEKYGVKATFFVVGWRVYQFRDLMLTMSQNGHEIGNHSYDHPYLSRLGEEEIKEQLQMTNSAVLKLTGKEVKFCRPPYGSWNDSVSKIARELGLKLTFWTLNPEDWRSPGTDVIIKRILDQAKDGSIVLLHDKLQTQQMLPELIESLIDRNFEFVTVSELLS